MEADRERLVRVEAIQTAFMQQVDKQFGQTTDMFYALAAIITTLFVAVFGFAC
jgi:hypothetical protein